ncbi:hypothetical protein BKA63DRAFT_308194 [Paraphoma chrysanthemicola]|nr:hypothetical protein BKA63DRAFT_308194 [Paraphoma chrysanthemicola]
MFTKLLGNRYTLGIWLVMMTTALRVASSFLMSTIFAEDEYSKPLLVTLINSALFVVIFGAKQATNFCVPKRSLMRVLAEHQISCIERASTMTSTEDTNSAHASVQSDTGTRESSPIAVLPTTMNEAEDSPLLAETRPSCADQRCKPESSLTASEAARVGLRLSPLWFFSNYLLAFSLAHTTVSSVTIITATGSAWIMLLNTISTHVSDRVTASKIVSVALTIMGACIVAASPIPPHDTPSSPPYPNPQPRPIQAQNLLGNACAIAASMIHALYAVLLSENLQGRKVTLPAALFATIGGANLVLFGPMLVVLNYLGWEKACYPVNASGQQIGIVCAMVLGNATISALIDLLWVSGMVKTSPLIAIIGTKLSIPLAMLVQFVWLKLRPDMWSCIGAACVCGGFGLMIWKGP